MAQQHEENGGDLAADEAEAVHPYELAPVHNADVLDQLRVPAKEHTNEQKHNDGTYAFVNLKNGRLGRNMKGTQGKGKKRKDEVRSEKFAPVDLDCFKCIGEQAEDEH